MANSGSLARFSTVVALAFLLGVAISSTVYWLLMDTGNLNQLDDVAPVTSPSNQSPIHRGQDSSTLLANSSEELASNVQDLRDLTGIKSQFERDIALRSYLAKLDEAQVSDLLTQSQDASWDEVSRELMTVVQRLADLNPKLALSRALAMDPRGGGRSLVPIVFREWAHANLDEAIEHAKTMEGWEKTQAFSTIVHERTDLSEDTLLAMGRDFGLEQVVRGVIVNRKIEEAIEDPERAWNDLVIVYQNDFDYGWRISRVAWAWVETSGLGVLDQVQGSLTNEDTRRSVVHDILVNTAKSDPAGAFKYALTVENDYKNSIIRSVSRIWARSDPRAALSAASEIAKESARVVAEETVVSTWAENDPQKVLQSIEALPEHLREAALTNALRSYARSAPEEAAQMIAAMESGTMKSSGARTVVSTWAYQNHSAALEWILNEPGIEEIRTDLVRLMIYILAQSDSQLAFDVALVQPIENEGSGMGMFGYDEGVGMEAGVISSIVYSDMDKALELLPQVREGITRLVAFQSIASALLSGGEVDRAFGVVRQVPDSDREKFEMVLASTWAGLDPVGMLNSMDRMTSNKTRSRAAMMLIASNSFEKELTNEQLDQARKYLTEQDASIVEEGSARVLQFLMEEFGF